MTMCVVSAAIAAAATELVTRMFVNQVRLLHPTHADIVIEGSRGLDWMDSRGIWSWAARATGWPRATLVDTALSLMSFLRYRYRCV
jgi:hypothetical protein